MGLAVRPLTGRGDDAVRITESRIKDGDFRANRRDGRPLSRLVQPDRLRRQGRDLFLSADTFEALCSVAVVRCGGKEGREAFSRFIPVAAIGGGDGRSVSSREPLLQTRLDEFFADIPVGAVARGDGFKRLDGLIPMLDVVCGQALGIETVEPLAGDGLPPCAGPLVCRGAWWLRLRVVED